MEEELLAKERESASGQLDQLHQEISALEGAKAWKEKELQHLLGKSQSEQQRLEKELATAQRSQEQAVAEKAAQSEKLAQKVVALTKDLQSHDAEKARLLDALAAERRRAQEERGEKEARLAKVT